MENPGNIAQHLIIVCFLYLETTDLCSGGMKHGKMVSKGSLKAVCSMFYIIFFRVSSKSGVLNLLPSDNVIQSPYHPYTIPFKIKKSKRKELIS